MEARSTDTPFQVHTSVRLIGVAHKHLLWSLHGPKGGEIEILMACHRLGPRADILARVCFISTSGAQYPRWGLPLERQPISFLTLPPRIRGL